MGPVREQDTQGEHGADHCLLPHFLHPGTALTALALQLTQGIACSGAAANIPKSATDTPGLIPLGGEHGMGSS